MTALNPLLVGMAEPPIIAVTGWLNDVDLPPDRQLINLSQAAPIAPPPRALREHLAEAVVNRADAHLYGPVPGNPELRDEIAAQWSVLYGGVIVQGNVAITAGCNQAFCVAIATACAPGDIVMLPNPWYFNHRMWLDMTGIGCIPLGCDADMLPDLGVARAAMSERVRAIVLVSPNNPTGAEYPDGLMHGFMELAREYGAVLIVDETYRDFHSAPGAPHTLFRDPDWADTLVHLYSFSKAYRLTGHRVGAIVTGAARIGQAEKYLDTVNICPNQIGQIAALYGLQHLSDHVAGERVECHHRRDVLTAGFAESLPDWDLHGAGAYFAWVTPPFGLAAMEMARRLLLEQSLLVVPGAMFLPEGRETGALRIAFANADAEGISETIRRLAAFTP